ncbi:MAG: 3-deoxy-7-phosphoheptulonate synthase [Planctomycetia bacterium]|nr:3-deoxy-7-phosphoheptulonate synthase [Planctomycetia bacterium]
MIIVLKDRPPKNQVDQLIGWLKGLHVDVHVSEGTHHTILGVIGETSVVDTAFLSGLDIVESVKRIQEPYKNANRKFHPEDTVIELGNNIRLGSGSFEFMAGPCSVETEEQICLVAHLVKKAGAKILRGGAFKPRTSPYSFQGLRERGIKLLLEAKQETGLPIITEIMDLSQLPLFEDVDIVQVGARNMQNFELLKELGHIQKPILLKRGLANTLEEFLMSAEYIMAGGNEQVLLCERGIRTFETAVRNTLDISAIPLLKKMSHLPVIVDPSHATGIADLVKPVSMAAAAVGADGLIVEVHNDPAHALCDGKQSLNPKAFEDLVRTVDQIIPYAFRWKERKEDNESR